jgi:hypothetical protein
MHPSSWCYLILIAAAAALPASTAADSDCGLSPADARYFQTMLDDWSTITGEVLRLAPRPVPCWGALQLRMRRQPGVAAAAVRDGFRGNRKWWSQEEGLALFLLVDRWMPGWVSRVLSPEMASPVVLLEEATGG